MNVMPLYPKGTVLYNTYLIRSSPEQYKLPAGTPSVVMHCERFYPESDIYGARLLCPDGVVRVFLNLREWTFTTVTPCG